MCKANILRNVIAIAICLAATTFSAQAQLGGAIRNATNAARQAANRSAGQAATNATNAASNAATEQATQAAEATTQPASQPATAPASQPAAQPAAAQPAPAQTAAAQQPAPSQHPDKGAQYKRIFDAIESAKKETEYDNILNPYSGIINVRKGNIENKIFSCGDTEMAKVDAEMNALQAKLWEMYNALKAANKTPKYAPFEFIGCGQVLANQAAFEEAQASGLGLPSSHEIMPMPQTYTLASDVVKKIEEIYPRSPFWEDVRKAGGKVEKLVYTSNEWKDISYKEREWPYRDRKYRAIAFSILVKMPNEDFYRLYDNNGTYSQHYDSAGKLTDQITVTGGGGSYTKRKM